MLKDTIKPRDYQQHIAETASKQSTLVVLPTGMGKTLVAILVAVKRLEQYPDSKILVMAPTRPLNAQHQKSFEEFLTDGKISLVTGKISPDEREQIYKNSNIIVATPQTIQNDLENNKLHLKDFSFAVFDEAHRAVKDYAYPYVAKRYMLQSSHPLILALTASPGASKEKIDDICSNLFIKAVEIRSHEDTDVEQYVKQIDHELVFVELPEEFKKAKLLLEEILKDDTHWLREHHYTFTYKPSKTMLLEVQKKIIASFARSKKNYGAFWAMMRTASAIKVDHAMELVETQGIMPLFDFLHKISTSKKKTDMRLAKNPKFLEVYSLVSELHGKSIEHPKLGRTVEMVKGILEEKPDAKMIIFANFRSTVERINDALNGAGVKSTILIGQSMKEGKGLTQEQQIEAIRRFGDGEFSVMCGTQVSEEGLSIVDVDAVIFFEPVASEIRAIQRRGRTGRTSAGRAIFMITKDTRDEAYYYAAIKKERKMKDILYDMKEKGVKVKRDISLLDFSK